MDYILQLGLNKLRKSDFKKKHVQAVWLIDQILVTVEENLLDEEAGGADFRAQLESFRREILGSGAIGVSETAACGMLDFCRERFRKVRSRRSERDNYFAEIILFLRKSLAELTGDSNGFHDEMVKTTNRIGSLIKLEDIQDLRKRIADEVGALNRLVTEKQKRDKHRTNQLSRQISVLQKKLEAAKKEALIDSLTGTANRRNFDYTIQRWVIAHHKSEEPFTIAIFDIDNFKKVNDVHGHLVGDRVLIETAVEIGRNIRSEDFLARYGGEEFVVLSSGMKLPESEKRFSRLLKSFSERHFDCANAGESDASISLTLSCGVAEYALGESVTDLVKRADEALYEAKRMGKNMIKVKRRPLMSAFYEGRKRNYIA
ncbi:MAG TPA: GGDEF domain-containing protein [Acidobacteriota bacterium]|nr:GGDEF domain-containing protein [Acidobacteriota bacterium]